VSYRHVWPIITQETTEAVLRQLTPEGISYYKRQGVFAEFEETFAAMVHRTQALLFNSGTAALHAAMVALGFGPGDEVIVPSYTFPATVTPIFQTGAVPVLVDVDSQDGNIDPKAIEAAITDRTVAVIVTHLWGVPCDMVSITELCDRHGLKLIEDCSHAHGAIAAGQPVGSFGDVAAWSLQGQKLVTGGEGGIVAYDDPEYHYRSLLFGHYNKRCKEEIPDSHPLKRFAVTGMGLKLRAHPMAIAMANEQLSHLNEWHDVMNQNAGILTRHLKGIDGIRLPNPRQADEPSWYAFAFQVVRPLTITLAEFCQELNKAGIVDADMPGSTKPLNLEPLFQTPGVLFPQYAGMREYQEGDFPVAEGVYQNTIKLPIAARDNRAYRTELDRYAETIERVLDTYTQ